MRERALWCIWITCRFVSLVVFDRQRWWVRCWDRACGWATSIAAAACAGDDDGRPSFLGRLLFLAGGLDRGNDGGRRGAARYPRLGRRVRDFIFSTSTASLWEEFNQRERQQRRRQDADIVDPWGLLFGRTMSTTITLVTLTALFAIVRVCFVHVLVPECLADPRRLEAMTRCKSSHLLSSSSYAFGGNGGMAGGADDRGFVDRGVVEGGVIVFVWDGTIEYRCGYRIIGTGTFVKYGPCFFVSAFVADAPCTNFSTKASAFGPPRARS